MAELVILGAGLVMLAANMDTTNSKKDPVPDYIRALGKKREGWEQPTREEQKRRNPVVNQRVKGSSYNDAPFKVVTSNAGNSVITPEFRAHYTRMLQRNRLRPAKELDKVWRQPTQTLQSVDGVGVAHGLSTHMQDRWPIDIRTSYVPYAYSGALSAYKH